MAIPLTGLLHLPTAALAWPSLIGWLTLTLALTWTITGLILLLLGWFTLPRDPNKSADEEPPRRASPGLRVLGGAVLAFGAVAAGTLLLGDTAGWQAHALSLLGSTISLVYLVAAWLPHSLLGELVGWVIAELAQVGGWLGQRLYWLIGRVPYLPGFARSMALALWGDRGYALVNTTALALTAAVGGFAGWMSSSSRWRTSGVVTFLGLDFVAMGLIGFSLLIVESAKSPLSEGLGLWILGVEMLGMFLFLAYQFYTLEFLAGRHRIDGPAQFTEDPDWTPNVLVQVASYNEPPEIVEECLECVLRLDYPTDRFMIQLADDSTDSATVERLRAFCTERGIDFQHRSDRRGFKGGALNDGLRAVSAPVDLVAIVDSDYFVEPRFLRAGVQPFREEGIGFVQTPQAYRNAGVGSFARWYALADAYFYRVIQPVRARAQSMIFCGTMGMVRRTALESAGGWSETCVTEDAELSLRLLAAGWRGHYVPTIVGWGLAPDLMSAVRSQHRRWAFGGMQMLRMNREKLTSANLSLRQRVDFRMGGLFWVDGLFLVGVTAALASLLVASWFGVTLPIGSTAALAVIASAPLLLMVDGLVKIRLALRATTPVSIRDALGIMAFWYAIKLNDLRAALRGWWGAAMPFVRTPKSRRPSSGRARAFAAALRGSAVETSVAVGLVGIWGVTAYRWGLFDGRSIGLGPASLLIWLGYYSFAFASALGFDYVSRRAAPSQGDAARASEKAPAPHLETPRPAEN